MIACTLPALTDSIPERKRKELAGEVTRELQVVGNAASIAIGTWVRSNDKFKARAEEREKNIGWIRRMFTAWRVSHTERREEREAAGEVDDEEDDTPVVIPSSAVTTYPRGTPVPTPSVKVQVIEERVDLSNNLTWRQMIGVGVRRVVLARGELDKLEGPQYAARRAELRREAGEAVRARDRQAAVALQNEAEERGATEEEATGARTTRVGRPRGGIKVAARIGDRLRREIGRGRRPRVGDGLACPRVSGNPEGNQRVFGAPFCFSRVSLGKLASFRESESWSGAKSGAKLRKSARYPGIFQVYRGFPGIPAKYPVFCRFWPQNSLRHGSEPPQNDEFHGVSPGFPEETRGCCRETSRKHGKETR